MAGGKVDRSRSRSLALARVLQTGVRQAPPTLLTPPAEHGNAVYDLGSTRRLLDRHSGLPPSLVVALDRGHVHRITPTTPASPTCPGEVTSHAVGTGGRKEIRLHVSTVLGRTRRVRQTHVESANRLSVTSEVSGPGSQASSPGVVGHSSSRPHSPFPFLFSRSKNTNGRSSALSGSNLAQDVEEDVQRRADTPSPT